MSGPIAHDPRLRDDYARGAGDASGAQVEHNALSGVDADTLAALKSRGLLTQEAIDDLVRKANDGGQAIDDLTDDDKHNGDELSKLRGGVDDPLGKLSAVIPTDQMGSTPSLPAIPGSGAPMPTSALPGASQNQIGAAPNYAQLLSALSNAQEGPDGGLYSNGVKVADGPGGQCAVDAEGRGRRVQEMANKLAAAHIPYAYGGGGPGGPGYGQKGLNATADACGDYRKVGFDCSSLAQYVNANALGVSIPRTSEAQYAAGQVISASQARPGDLFFPTDAGRPPGHVQVYVGGNQVLEAPSSNQYIKFSPLRAGEFRRFTPY